MDKRGVVVRLQVSNDGRGKIREGTWGVAMRLHVSNDCRGRVCVRVLQSHLSNDCGNRIGDHCRAITPVQRLYDCGDKIGDRSLDA